MLTIEDKPYGSYSFEHIDNKLYLYEYMADEDFLEMEADEILILVLEKYDSDL